jgi:hypothetical protein
MTFELKPCPFCGQPAVGPVPLAEDGWRVHCGNDPSQCVWPYFDTSRSPDAAVSMWNSRRDPYSSPETPAEHHCDKADAFECRLARPGNGCLCACHDKQETGVDDGQ